MNPTLKKLYQEVILQHHKNPFQFQKEEGAALILEANNPLCGDRYRLYLDLDNNKITNAHFHGFGCAISTASTSILVENLIGKTREEARALCQSFIQHVDGENRSTQADHNFKAFEAVDEFPERRSCAVLAWEVVLNWEL
jgi:nitrogen fixation NifU-like protein